MLTAFGVFLVVGVLVYMATAHFDRKEREQWDQERETIHLDHRDWGED